MTHYIIHPLRKRIHYNSRLAKLIIRSDDLWALTLGEWVFCKRDEINEWAQWHEWRHVQQWRWFLYVGFPLAYGIGALIGWRRGDAYWRNPLEKDACRYASKHADPLPGQTET